MSVKRNEKLGTWEVQASYKDFETKKRKIKHKRGFKTKREAQEYERNFLASEARTSDILFNNLYEKYLDYIIPRIKKTTLEMKMNMVEVHLLPILGTMKLRDIDRTVIFKWQTHMVKARKRNGEGYATSYIRTVENQLSAILNFAVRLGYITENPLKVVGRVAKKEQSTSVDFWTQDEFETFAEAVMDKPLTHAAFEIMFWCGLRVGEVLALTPSDISTDPVTGIYYVSVTKNWQRYDGSYHVTTPKSKKSIRKVPMPDVVAEETLEYARLFMIGDTDRLFPTTKHTFSHEIQRGCKATGVKRIRVHDLRHSYATMLIHEQFSIIDIANLMGHETTEVTLRYGHLMPNANDAVVKRLNARAAHV